MLRYLLPTPRMVGLLLALFLTSPPVAQAALLREGIRVAPADALPTDRIIVKWRESGVAALRIADPVERIARLVNATGLPLRSVRALGSRLDIIRLNDIGAATPREQRAALESAITQLRLDPSVEYAEADERIYLFAAPNDPRFSAGSDSNGSWGGQWYLNAPSVATPAAIGALPAWELTTGAGINVAVLDSGIRADHPDISAKLLPGRDFVCHDNLSLPCTSTSPGTLFLTANDGDSWDADPSDPGDGITVADLVRSDGFFKGCGTGSNSDQPLESSWHGLHVAGLIGAIRNNGIGIAGVAPDSRITPVRVIGKCTGYTSDLVAALYWAAGIIDSSLGPLPPANAANVAQIINLSLGNRLDCSTAEQNAIDAVIAKGILIVAAAGNDGGPIGSPANCRGVLSVAGLRHNGLKVGYSNVSSTAAKVSIAAPAGNCVNTAPGAPCLYSLDTLSNAGRFTPEPSNKDTSYTYASLIPSYTGNTLNGFSVGTSFAAPMVSAVAALMLNAHPGLTPQQILQRIQDSAAAFPTPDSPPTGGVCHVATLNRDSHGVYSDVQDRDCQCTTATCGAGMVNALAAVAAALRPAAVARSSVPDAGVGQRVTLDGSGSTAAKGHTLVSYAWTSDQGIGIANANSPVAQLTFPAFRPITLTLTVVDDAGQRDSQTVTVNSTIVSASGGGALDAETLCLLSLLLLSAGRRAHTGRNRN